MVQKINPRKFNYSAFYLINQKQSKAIKNVKTIVEFHWKKKKSKNIFDVIKNKS